MALEKPQDQTRYAVIKVHVARHIKALPMLTMTALSSRRSLFSNNQSAIDAFEPIHASHVTNEYWLESALV
jgi:hypothetical protein